MNNLDKQYTDLLQDILDNGSPKSDRTGTGTISVFGRQIRHKMSEGFPALTTKKIYFKGVVTELLWFLRGDTNIKYLVDNNCHIWDGDAYKAYQSTTENPLSIMEFIDTIKNDSLRARTLGELGPVYGKQWRSWKVEDNGQEPPYYNETQIDQIANLIHDLKTNPDSRRLMVSAWNPGQISQMVLPPCHYGFQVYTRELSEGERGLLLQPYGLDPLTKEGRDRLWKENNLPTRAISLMWSQRSADAFLGVPFNIASYGLLLEIIAKEVNMVPDELIGNLGDTHIYLNHIEQAKEQIGRELTLEERRELVSQDEFNKVYTGGSPDTLSHSEIDQFGVPRRTREPFKLPKLLINYFRSDSNSIINDTTKWSYKDFQIEDYSSHPSIKAPLSN